MSIFERALPRAGIATVLATVVAIVLSPSDPALADMPIHPAWVIAIVAAARFGVGGLFAVPAVVLGGQLAVWLSGKGDLAMVSRLAQPGELGILVVIAAVAAIGSLHEQRKALLEERLRGAESRAAESETAVGSLCETSLVLRDRVDRSHMSLAFLSDLAARIDDRDVGGASGAALDLAMARTGARCAFVQVIDGGRPRMLCSRGKWSAERDEPPAVFRDVVANAAIEQLRPMAAHEVANASPDDCDLAAPILDGAGNAIGILALRGVTYTALNLGAREDLTTIARWTSRVLAKANRGSRPELRGSHRAKT